MEAIDSNATDIFRIIQNIQKGKENNHIIPSHVLFSEICNFCHSDPRKELNRLFLEGKIIYFKTLNQLAFKTTYGY